MDYKTYALMAILLVSLASVAPIAPIGTTYATTDTATTNATDTATTNATDTATTNATGGEWSTFDLTVGDQTFPIEYMIDGGSVENMTVSSQNSTLGVSINSTDDGTLVIRLPRNVIDSKTGEGADTTFDAIIDNAEYVEPGENETTAEDIRTLSIGFPLGSETIDVIGTVVIPEFSTIAVVVLAVAIVGIIIATARHSKFNFAPRL
jgi:predicted secreted protein with PEFG-CTERM motif